MDRVASIRGDRRDRAVIQIMGSVVAEPTPWFQGQTENDGVDSDPSKTPKSLPCSDVMEQLADYLDADAREELCREIKSHLDRCHDCQVYVDTVKKTIVLYQSDHGIRIPLALSQNLKAAMARAYRRGMGASD